jgi:hypothetical protein
MIAVGVSVDGVEAVTPEVGELVTTGVRAGVRTTAVGVSLASGGTTVAVSAGGGVSVTGRAVAVLEGTGVSVGVPVWVGADVGVRVGVAVCVGVAVRVAVLVGVAVVVGVSVGTGVSLKVTVGVGGTGVGVNEADSVANGSAVFTGLGIVVGLL